MSPEEFRRHGHKVVDWIADYLAHPERYPVLAQVSPGYLLDQLPASGPEQGEPMDEILGDFQKFVIPGMTHWNHPSFFAYFSISGSGPGILGEMLAAALNVNGMLWKTSPAVTELEQVALAWLRQWIGLPDNFFGIIYDTASISSMHAIAAAREMAAPEVHRSGGTQRLVLYTSEQAHSSIEKGAIAIGVGQQNVRKIPVDGQFRMIPDALAASIRQDRERGLQPFCISATVGTTSTTSVDPVPAIADIAEQYGLWLHVDAAYAGSAAIVPECRYALAGAERADSLVTNPHKWLFTPTDLSAFYTRRPDILRRAFSLVPEYLRTADNPRAVNFMDYGVQLGRRFRALKLWFVLRYYGREGIIQLIREHIRLAQEFASWVDADPDFERTAPTPFSVVCFRHRGGAETNQALLDRVNATGEVFLSHTALHGEFTLRLAIGNMRTEQRHVERAWELIRSEAARL